MDYFIVGLSDHGYESGPVILGTYHVCYQHPFKVNHSEIWSVDCSRPLRMANHLIIQQPATGTGSLCFCEVEAFADITR